MSQPEGWLTAAYEAVKHLIPGFLGSAGALLWLKDTWPRKLAMVCLGVATSYYASPFFSQVFSLDAGLSGFLVGLFGMSIVDSIFRTWENLGITKLIREFIRARLGLPPKED